MASAQEQLQEYSYQTPMSFDDFWKMNNPQYGFVSPPAPAIYSVSAWKHSVYRVPTDNPEHFLLSVLPKLLLWLFDFYVYIPLKVILHLLFHKAVQ